MARTGEHDSAGSESGAKKAWHQPPSHRLRTSSSKLGVMVTIQSRLLDCLLGVGFEVFNSVEIQTNNVNAILLLRAGHALLIILVCRGVVCAWIE